MAALETLFVTRVYSAMLAEAGRLGPELDGLARQLAVDDTAGIAWCRRNRYPGYTSYASLNDLPWRFPAFRALVRAIDPHVKAFAKACDMVITGKRPVVDSLWVNLLPPGGFHGAHIHPQSAVSGTYYVAMPPGASALRFEDPRLPLMMAAPVRKPKAARENATFVSVPAVPGTVLLWESFLRHEVPPNEATEERISISFNYRFE